MSYTQFSAVNLPAGLVAPFAGNTVPSGWLECDGSAVSRTTYAALFTAIGTLHGAGNGTTTFNLPGAARRTIVGAGGSGTATLGNSVGNTGGAETHTLTGAESGTSAHTHTNSVANDSGHTHTFPVYRGSFSDGVVAAGEYNGYPLMENRSTSGVSATHNHAVTINNSSEANASSGHNNIQPSIIMKYIIKT